MSEEVTQRRLDLAYLAVFGPDGKRNGDQELVWRDLEYFCYAYRPVTEKLTSAQLDPGSLMLNDGRRTVWLRARSKIVRAQTEPKETKISRQKPSKKQ